MNKKEWVSYVNRHIDLSSGLPTLTVERLDRWEKLGLLVPDDSGYSRTDLERTLALLMYEKSLLARASTSSKK